MFPAYSELFISEKYRRAKIPSPRPPSFLPAEKVDLRTVTLLEKRDRCD